MNICEAHCLLSLAAVQLTHTGEFCQCEVVPKTQLTTQFAERTVSAVIDANAPLNLVEHPR